MDETTLQARHSSTNQKLQFVLLFVSRPRSPSYYLLWFIHESESISAFCLFSCHTVALFLYFCFGANYFKKLATTRWTQQLSFNSTSLGCDLPPSSWLPSTRLRWFLPDLCNTTSLWFCCWNPG